MGSLPIGRPAVTRDPLRPPAPDGDDPADLELSPGRMTDMGRAVLDRVVSHLAGLDGQPACGIVLAENPTPAGNFFLFDRPASER